MLILVSRGTSSGTRIFTFLCSFVLVDFANELSTWTRAPRGLCHVLVFCSLPLPGTLLRHPSVLDPFVVHHSDPGVVCQSVVYHNASECSSSDRHISRSRTNTCSATTESIYTSPCRGTNSDQVSMHFFMRRLKGSRVLISLIRDGLSHATNVHEDSTVNKDTGKRTHPCQYVRATRDHYRAPYLSVERDKENVPTTSLSSELSNLFQCAAPLHEASAVNKEVSITHVTPVHYSCCAQCNLVTLGIRLPIQPSAVGNRSLMWPYHITGTPGCSTPLCSVPLTLHPG